jgi:hypothetical protein
VHRPLRRLAALLVLAVPVSLVGRSGSTWGAAPAAVAPPREAHAADEVPLASERPVDERSESAVVLVVLDGVRWQEVFGGADRALARERGLNPLAWAGPRALMPNVHRMLESHAVAVGAPGHGAEVTASGPQYVSLPGYLEIFAGHPDPLCETNRCTRTPARTVTDDVLDACGADDAAVVASWPTIARAAARDASRVMLTAGRTRAERADVLRDDPATAEAMERGAGAKAYPGEGDYRPDAYTAKVALGVLESRRPRFLFVGLGDADEYGHRNDYHGYLEAIHASDAFLGELFATLDRMGARGRHTTVLVTADHGRSYGFKDHGGRYPESGRVWLFAGGADVQAHGMVAAPHRHTLSDVAPTVRALLGMPAEGSAFPEVLGATLGTPARR